MNRLVTALLCGAVFACGGGDDSADELAAADTAAGAVAGGDTVFAMTPSGMAADSMGANGGAAAGDPDAPVSNARQPGARTPASGGATRPAAPSGGGAASNDGSSESTPNATAPSNTGSSQTTADSVVALAARAYAGVRSLQADFAQKTTNPVLGRETTSRGTIYQRRPDRFLMKFSQPDGDRIVADGEHIWVYYPSADPGQVIRAPVSAAGAGGVDLQAQFVGDPTTRFAATLNGTEAVGGRDAWVVTLDPRANAPYSKLKVWIDRRDHLVRRFEITELNGVVRHFDLSNLRTNLSLSDDVFRFTPPDGVRVIDRG